MFAAAKTASDVQTDEECEELVDESFCFSADFLEKTPRRKRSSGKPPHSPKSPYLASMDLNPRRAAWRRARASLGDTRGGTPGDRGSARLPSPSNGLGLTFSSGELREKEDMYDEIIRLKKSLQAQRSDNQQLKARLQRLEEDHARREKQIQELLDPSKGSEFTRSLVDKKKEGGVVVTGLKQRILKLEQQCREKENALSNLQSQLRTTTLTELSITVDTYCQEILRLKMLLAAAEKSGRAESKCSQRQQKALSVTVHRLTENLKQLQQENVELKEELDTGSPAGLRGYRDWSRQRLLRRLLELEQLTNQRPQDGRGHAHSGQGSGRPDPEVVTVATEAMVSVGTATEGEEELPDLRERLSQLEEERAELQELLLSREEELKQLKAEREEETERWKTDRDRERQEHSLEVDQLVMKIRTLESKAEEQSVSDPSPEDKGDREEEEEEEKEEEEEEEEGDEGAEGQKRRQEAALVIQSRWRQHRKQDTVQLQSALRAHLVRVLHLRDQQRATDSQAGEMKDGGHVGSSQWDVTLIQSVLRGHLTRCGVSVDSSRVWSLVPSPVNLTFLRTGDEEQRGDGDPCVTSRLTPPTGSAPSSLDSDDSDDIIMSPSHPLRTSKVLMM
ncbi:uncharacterized protein V6R79_008430 [Siganus canaliculatus]